MSRSQFATLGVVGLALLSVSCSHTSGAGAAARPSDQNAQKTQLSQQPAHVRRSDGSASSEQLDALMKQRDRQRTLSRSKPLQTASPRSRASVAAVISTRGMFCR
jgi:hypothetical protein